MKKNRIRTFISLNTKKKFKGWRILVLFRCNIQKKVYPDPYRRLFIPVKMDFRDGVICFFCFFILKSTIQKKKTENKKAKEMKKMSLLGDKKGAKSIFFEDFL